MASLRLCIVKSVLRNVTRSKTNNVNLILHRENHVLTKKRLRSLLHQTSPKLLCDVQGSHLYRLSCSLEHTLPFDRNLNKDSAVDDAQLSNLKDVDNVSALNSADGTTGNVSDIASIIDESVLPPVPIPPAEGFTLLGEPTLRSLGLAGWSPVGIVQQILEFYHVHFDLPWWGAIAGLTLTLRFFMLPLTIKMKRDMVNYQNNMPQFQYLQMKMSEARKSGDYFEAARCGHEFSQFMQEKKIMGIGMFAPYFIQFPVFVSVYFALREMAGVPDLKSFQTGGLLWFTDLSVPDQFYLLPLLTSVTIWATMKYSSGAAAPLQNLHYSVQKLVEFGLPGLAFLFTMRFPAATLCYWTTTNLFVLIQTYIMSFEPVKKYCKIPAIENFPQMPQLKPGGNKKGFVEGFKESYTNLKITHELEDRERLNAAKFEETGTAPARRTFKFDPTKRQAIPNLVQSKEKK